MAFIGDASERNPLVSMNAAPFAATAEKQHSVDSPLEECMRIRGVSDAWDMLEAMMSKGLPATRFTVSRMLMKTVGDSRSTKGDMAGVFRAIGLAEIFIQRCPEEADEVLFNALLDTCYRARDLSRLESVVKCMQELQVYPSHVTLGILVKAYGQAGDCAQVLRLWDDMKEQREQANAVTYGCMIDACVKCGFMQKAVEIFQDMKRRRKHRNTILYTTLIKGYGLEKDLRSALALFREMKDERVPYNRITYNSIIDVCIKCSDVQAAENILAEMTSSSSNLEPDLITYSTILKGYCHIGDLDKALQVAESIKAGGLRCDELVYNTLMDGCVRANDLSAGIGLFAEMTHSGMIPSMITHSILMRLYQQSGYTDQAAEAVAQLYEHHGIPRPSTPFTNTGAPEIAYGGSSVNTGRRISNKGRRNGGRGGRGRTQRSAQGGVGAGSMGLGHPAVTYLNGVPPQGLSYNPQQFPFLPNFVPSILPGVSNIPASQWPRGDFNPEITALPHGHVLHGQACNTSHTTSGVLLGPEPLLIPYAHMEADATWNMLQNSYHIPCVPGEAAKPPFPTGAQKSSEFSAGSQIWGGA